jgi:CRP/FNR family transcriptional activator FtrB
MHTDDMSVVREISLFAGMTDEHFDEVLQTAYLKTFPARVQLIEEGAPADFLYVIVEGTVEMYSKLNDRETTMLVLRPSSTFILAAVLKDAVYLMSARTLDSTRVLMIPAKNVREVMEIDPAFARAMVTELAKGYRSVIRAFKEQKLRSGLERLANYLIRMNAQMSGRGQVELSEDKRTLAALLGLTPEYLSRAFKKLGEYGVEVNGSKIRLTNLRVLKRLAKPTPLIDNREV